MQAELRAGKRFTANYPERLKLHRGAGVMEGRRVELTGLTKECEGVVRDAVDAAGGGCVPADGGVPGEWGGRARR